MADYLPLAQQLNILFEALPHQEGRAYTLQEVSAATGISQAALSQMRNGKITNPQLNTLRALCAFFHVPLRFFESHSVEACYAVLNGADEQTPSAVSEIAFRATRLSEAAQRDILTMIKWVQAAEQQRKQGSDLPPLPHLEDYDDA